MGSMFSSEFIWVRYTQHKVDHTCNDSDCTPNELQQHLHVTSNKCIWFNFRVISELKFVIGLKTSHKCDFNTFLFCKPHDQLQNFALIIQHLITSKLNTTFEVMVPHVQVSLSGWLGFFTTHDIANGFQNNTLPIQCNRNGTTNCNIGNNRNNVRSTRQMMKSDIYMMIWE